MYTKYISQNWQKFKPKFRAKKKRHVNIVLFCLSELSLRFIFSHDAEYSIFNAAVGALRSAPHKVAYLRDKGRIPFSDLLYPTPVCMHV